MGVACGRLLKILDDTARDSAISKIYPQVMERITSWRSILLTRSRSVPYSSTWCDSLAVGCCTYLIHQTLHQFGRTKSLGYILR